MLRIPETTQRLPRVSPVSSTTASMVFPARPDGGRLDENASMTEWDRTRLLNAGRSGDPVSTSSVSEYSVSPGRTGGRWPFSEPGGQTRTFTTFAMTTLALGGMIAGAGGAIWATFRK